jgi:hypothetical protein
MFMPVLLLVLTPWLIREGRIIAVMVINRQIARCMRDGASHRGC